MSTLHEERLVRSLNEQINRKLWHDDVDNKLFKMYSNLGLTIRGQASPGSIEFVWNAINLDTKVELRDIRRIGI